MAAAERDPATVLPGVAPAPGRVSLTRAGLVIAFAMAAANGLNYAFNIVMSRALGPAEYGALAALLAVVLVGSVPALALQAVVARHTTLRRAQDLDQLWPAVLTAAAGLGAALGLLAVVAGPALRTFLHLDSLAPCLWLAAALLPLPLLSAVQGALQGREWFGALAAVLIGAAAGRLVIGLGLVSAGLGIVGAMAGTAAGSVVAVLVALPRVRAELARAWRRWRWPGAAAGRELATATAGIFGLLLLANVDVVLARHFLAPEAAGLYAAGAVLTKIAYWAPQFVVTVVFPRLVVTADRGRLLARSAAVVAGLGALVVVGAALAPQLAARLTFGQAYLGVGPTLPLFAALGTGLALVQLVLFSGLAAADRRMHRLLLAAVAAETLLVTLVLHRSVAQIVTAALAVVGVLLVAGFAHIGRRPAGAGAPPPAEAGR